MLSNYQFFLKWYHSLVFQIKVSEIHNALKGCAKIKLNRNMSFAMASAMGKKNAVFPVGHSTATIFYLGRLTLPLVSDSGHN